MKAFNVIIICCVCIAANVLPQVSAGLVPFYRYFNGREHFYTTNENEIGTTTYGHEGRYGFRSEGTQCRIHNKQVPGTVPLYRYWNGKDHFYTTDPLEIGTTVPGVVGNHGYRAEGIAGYCFPSRPASKCNLYIPLYRGYGNNDHFYTTSADEMANSKYTFEGVACYVGKVY